MTTTPEPGVAALLAAAQKKMDSGDFAGARAILEGAGDAAPDNVSVKLQLALACRMQDDNAAALSAINAALVLDNRSLIGWLSKGVILDALGDRAGSVAAYRAALDLSPPVNQLPPTLQKSVERARQAVREYSDLLHEHLLRETAELRQRYSGESLERFEECLEIFSGKTRAFVQQPALLHFPRLPALPFYDDSFFPWLPELEAATDVIREEMLTVMREDWQTFHPYIQYPPDVPVNQWAELNHSPAWSTFDLWRDGRKFDENCRRCPRTAALLERLPMAQQPGYAPNAMFSVLAPRAHIPPHTGSTNVRVIVHLPLLLPPNCRYRVGNDHRQWKMGKAWVFDDTIEHEAWNGSDEVRVLLIFDVWNPLLTQAERELISAMMLAKRTLGQGRAT